MGLFKVIKKRLTNQFIAVSLYEDQCKIKVKRIKNGDVLLEEERIFSLASKDTLSQDVIIYINHFQEEYEQTYVSLFLNTSGQGIVPSCLKSVYEKMHIDYDNVKHICIQKKYSIYASLIDIRWAEKVFKNIGLDFIFSPFLICNSLMQKVIPSDGINLYILASNNAITIVIKKNSKILYGTFINIAKEEDLLNIDYDKEEFGSEELESQMLDEVDLDLDIEEMNDFSETMNEGNKSQQKPDSESLMMSSNLFGQDLRFVKYLDASLREFYDSTLYESDFVNHVTIFDGTGINKKIITYIKETLLVEVQVKPVDILDILMQLCEEESSKHA